MNCGIPGCILQGRYAEAQPLLERALAIKEVALGANQIRTVWARVLLGDLYKKQGSFEQASPLLEEAVNALERLDGHDHDVIASALSKRADLLKAQVRVFTEYRVVNIVHIPSAGGSAAFNTFFVGTLRTPTTVKPLYEWSGGIQEQGLEPEYSGVVESLNHRTGLLIVIRSFRSEVEGRLKHSKRFVQIYVPFVGNTPGSLQTAAA